MTAGNDSERQITAEHGSDGGPPAAARAIRRRWPRWVAMVLLGLVIFGSGIVIGSVGTLTFVRRAMVRAVKHPEQLPDRAIARMTRRYDLTPEQQAEVGAILRTRMQRMTAIRQQLRPYLDAELDSLRDDVAGVLTEEQATQWQHDFGRLRNAIQVPMHAPLTPPEKTSEPSPPSNE